MSGVSDDQSLPRIPEMGSDERAMLREFAGVLREHRVRNQVARHGLDILARELENLSRPV